MTSTLNRVRRLDGSVWLLSLTTALTFVASSTETARLLAASKKIKDSRRSKRCGMS